MLNLDTLRHRLVVSCQAPAESPLRGTDYMMAMARAALLGNAAGLRAEGLDDVRALSRLGRPVIGLVKREEDGSPVYITPSVADVRDLCAAGASIVAADVTMRPRRSGEATLALVEAAHRGGALFMADVDSLAAAGEAVAAGADMVSSTLSGYTGRVQSDEPDIALVNTLARSLPVPVFAEGRYRTPEQVERAFAAGAFCVVVGGAITDPLQITRRFVAACPQPVESLPA
ncbi:N-acetylmannosamine-6-phosphate 2-epimerase [Devosia sediminis]|uniref:N-acylglucosamine-6-phosphate 2-epimerase n=1 Tax=Devosia sediminis TaxID=2798801 RepID=A0A934MIM4_9HYPH|nr:N-acetylmannosamine-6-phosphate 2-epimerase [Devosia sediminis]MBJ3783108.1 N-acetylmannosamine-6-phosphate 2-epimerase [Devosia sediminis]